MDPFLDWGQNGERGRKETQVTAKLLEGWGSPGRWDFRPGGPSSYPWEKGFRQRVRPLPALAAQDEGLPVLKGRLREKLEMEGLSVETEGARLPPRRRANHFPLSAREPGASLFTNLSAPCGRRCRRTCKSREKAYQPTPPPPRLPKACSTYRESPPNSGSRTD